MEEGQSDSILYIEHVAGIAGDMFAASCINAGVVTAEEIQDLPALLGFAGDAVWVEVSEVLRANLSATHVDIHWEDAAFEAFPADKGEGDAHHHRHVTYQAIDELIRDSGLTEDVKNHARQILYLLGAAEAKVHAIDIEQVAFHEVGDIDSILDVVMAGYCIAKIAPQQVYSSPVKLGRGVIEIQHGDYPVPPPASAILSEGFSIAGVPETISDPNIELSTPTGLAILKSLTPAFVDSWPPGTVQKQGMGAGTRDLGKYPNILRVVLLEGEVSDRAEALPYKYGEVVEIVCNVDDQTPERTAWILEQLMEQGALDAWLTPVTGKKNRLGTMISVLAESSSWGNLADWLLRNSSTFGVRYRPCKRLELLRMSETRTTGEHQLRYKMGYTVEGEKLKEKPEFDDLSDIWKTDPHFEG